MEAKKGGSENSSVDLVALAHSIVLDSESRKIKMGQLWQSQAVIFVFLQHFACIACRAHSVGVWKDRERYERTGARLIFVGKQARNYIENLKSELGLQKAMILTDPSLEVFRAAGFRHGFFELVQLKSILNAIKLAGGGHSQATLIAEGSNWQNGGVPAVGKNGKVHFHFISQALGDFPNEADIELILSIEAKTLQLEKGASKRIGGIA